MRLSRRIMYLQRRLPSWCVLSPNNLSCVLVFALVYLTLRAYLHKVTRQRAFVYQLAPPKDDSAPALGRIFVQHETIKSARDCPLLSLTQSSSAEPGFPLTKPQESVFYGSCRRVPPVPGSCDVANQIFFSSPPATCSHQRSFNFCQLEANKSGQWKVVCNETSTQVCLSNLLVGLMNQTTGGIDWMEYESVSKVSDMLNRLLREPSSSFNHFGFSFIKCVTEKGAEIYDHFTSQTGFEDYYPDVDSADTASSVYGEQLLILPPHFKKIDVLGKRDLRNSVSVNILFVDSVSRQHFFRSLNASVGVLNKITMAPRPVASVFDFELVQAVRSRTFESLQAIFAGIVDTTTKPFGVQDVPPEPLKLEFMLAGFKKQGYHTLWLEDLCHRWEWGLPKDLHFMLDSVHSDTDFWRQMWRQLSAAELDDVGPTLAMCRVLQANGVPDHFHGPDAVCYNGRHQHEYLLDYLLLHQLAAQTAQRPTFTFTMTNVAHEDSGRRIQTLDLALASYIESVSQLPNTLTIVLSDHGNAYGEFLEQSSEAQIELYHPAMFFIVPNRVGSVLGVEAMQALKVNSKRLVSFLDLHKALLYIQNPKEKLGMPLSAREGGLFSTVKSSRTCDDIPRIMPNLCICNDFETAVENDTSFNLLAYFAVGRLNDEIQRQADRVLQNGSETRRKEEAPYAKAFPNCQRLILQGVDNIKTSTDKSGSLTIKMELAVQVSQVFLVSLIMRPLQLQKAGSAQGSLLKLQTVERLTSYSQFAPCASADHVWQYLCVCDLGQAEKDLLKHSKGSKVSDGNWELSAKEMSVHDGFGIKFEDPGEHYNVSLDLNVEMKHLFTNVKEDSSKPEKDYTINQYTIPQYHDYLSEKVLPKFQVKASYATQDGLEKSNLTDSNECVLLVWVTHPQGFVLSAANTCQTNVYVFSSAVIEHEEREREGPKVIYTAPPVNNTIGAFLMPGGTRLLAVALEEGYHTTELVRLNLKVVSPV